MKTIQERNEIVAYLKQKFAERCETEKHELSLNQIILFAEVFGKIKQVIPEITNGILICMLFRIVACGIEIIDSFDTIKTCYYFEMYNQKSPEEFISEFVRSYSYNSRLEMGK